MIRKTMNDYYSAALIVTAGVWIFYLGMDAIKGFE